MEKEIIVDYETREVDSESVVQTTDPETGEIEREVVETGTDYKTVAIREEHLLCDGCTEDLGRVDAPDAHARVSPPPTISDDSDHDAHGRALEFIDGIIEDFKDRARAPETIEIDDVPIETYDDLRVAYLNAITQSEITEAIGDEAFEKGELGDSGAYNRALVQDHMKKGRAIHDRAGEEATYLSYRDVEELLYEHRKALEATPMIEIEDTLSLCRGCAAMIGIDVDAPTVPDAWIRRPETDPDEDSGVYHTSTTKLDEEYGPATVETGTSGGELSTNNERTAALDVLDAIAKPTVDLFARIALSDRVWYILSIILFAGALLTGDVSGVLFGAVAFTVGFLLDTNRI